jgi:ribosomal protein L37AE/L43A
MNYRYAVIICPNCKKAKIIEKEKKTTTCTKCNKKHLIKNLKVYYESNSQYHARKIIGILHAQQDNKQDEVINFLLQIITI